MRRMQLINATVVLAVLASLGAACAADGKGESKARASAPTPRAEKTQAQTVVYYFHGASRCSTCRTIEAYAAEALKAGFDSDLASGRLAWRPVNVDEAANQHFIKDYQLYTRSLVVVDGMNPKRFKNLEKVWQLVGDKPAFLGYVQDEVRAFRKP